jgi:diguanylate cyclase (GGDEF)-like protein
MGRAALLCLAGAAIMAAALACVGARATAALPDASTTFAALLTQADNAWPDDPSRFQRILAQLHQHEGQLSARQRWHLRLLDTRQPAAEGDYGKVEPVLNDIIDHSGDPPLSVRAMAALVRDKFLGHDYVGAYTLANTLMAELPGVGDPQARREGMIQVILMLNQETVGQYDLALDYARQMKALLPSGKGQCYAHALEAQSLLYAGKLTSTSPGFLRAIDACLAAGVIREADALRLDLASAMIDEGRAVRAIAFLRRIAPEIQATRYTPYLASLQVTLAQAYLSLGDVDGARKYALASVAIVGPHSSLWTLRVAYQVLYQAEKKGGHDAAALAYYENYVALQKAAMDDAKARALAYQMVRQQVLSRKMQVDALDKQNRILQLRQALARQAQKTSRLFIALLLAVVAFTTLAMVWLWRSRLRFRRMARYDGLTGVLNREHFFAEAEHVLQRLHRAKAGVCLVVMDMDHFKRVNDTHGHASGDEVLRQAVACCRRELRATDVCGRLGGEEFGILMPVASCEEGTGVVTRIRCALAARPVVLGNGTAIMISASFGLAWSADAGHGLRPLLIDADAALYRAKNGGRNCVAVSAGGDAPAIVADEAELAMDT